MLLFQTQGLFYLNKCLAVNHHGVLPHVTVLALKSHGIPETVMTGQN